MKANKLIIRADADSQIGTGHIMRCIALAQGWQDRGGEVTFISHCESDALKERILNEGCRFVFLEKVCPEASDLKTTLSISKSESVGQKSFCVLDGYHFTSEYQKAIRNAGIRLLVIDDMNHLPRYYADILLNQNINAPDLIYQGNEDTTLLMGTRYALLRREFLKYSDFKRQIPDQVKNILVTLGGADSDNVTLKVIGALKLLNDPGIAARIVIGPANPHQVILRKALASTQFKSELLVNPQNMPALMAWADMAVSAGGSTCWELLFFKLPNVILSCADNQRPIADKLHEQGLALNLGYQSEVSDSNISEAMKPIINDQDMRTHMIKNAVGLINGQGAARVCETLEEIQISI
jgi:UDP-2,4-diacetamido-2,4,6-trideoxy-beta-L-altropyranose hydrolase